MSSRTVYEYVIHLGVVGRLGIHTILVSTETQNTPSSCRDSTLHRDIDCKGPVQGSWMTTHAGSKKGHLSVTYRGEPNDYFVFQQCRKHIKPPTRIKNDWYQGRLIIDYYHTLPDYYHTLLQKGPSLIFYETEKRYVLPRPKRLHSFEQSWVFRKTCYCRGISPNLHSSTLVVSK